MIKFINQEENLRGKLLIISYGRTPTIAGDYLITGNGFKRIAFYHSDYLEPSVGYLHEKI